MKKSDHGLRLAKPKTSITSLAGLRKAVENKKVNKMRNEWEMGVNSGLKHAVDLISEFEAGVRERLEERMKEVEKGDKIQYELFVEARAECSALRRVLDGGIVG